MCKNCNDNGIHESQGDIPILSYEIISRMNREGDILTVKYSFTESKLYIGDDGEGDSIDIQGFNTRKANSLRKAEADSFTYTFSQFDQNGKPYIVKAEAVIIAGLLEYKPECFECSDVIEGKPVIIGKNNYCESCSDDFCECSNCNDVIKRDDSFEREGETYCENCESELFFYCEHCNETHSQDDINNFNDSYYCDSCINDVSFECAGCSERFSNDDSNYSERDENDYCESCYPGEGSETEFDSHNLNLENNTFEKLNQKFRFGIELEIDDSDLNYSDIEQNTCFGCKDDGSLDKGSEFYSPIMQGDKGFSSIEKFCHYVKGNSVSTKAGFHLHIGSENFSNHDITKIWILYRIIEKYIFLILPESRRKNSYCKKSKIEIEHIAGIKNHQEFKNLWNCHENEGGTRYFGLNLKALETHKTIELRYHSGTVNFEKIINWIKFNFSIFEFACDSSIERILALQKITEKKDSNIENFKNLLNVLVKNDDVKNFYIARFENLNKNESEALQAIRE